MIGSKEIIDKVSTGEIKLSSRAIHVLTVMFGLAKRRGESFRVSILELTEKSGLSVNPVQGGINELISAGLIKKNTSVNKKAGKGAEYTVL